MPQSNTASTADSCPAPSCEAASVLLVLVQHVVLLPRQTPTRTCSRHYETPRWTRLGLGQSWPSTQGGHSTGAAYRVHTQPRPCSAACCVGVKYAAMVSKRPGSPAAKRRSCCPSAFARSMAVMGSSRKSMSSMLSSSASSATAWATRSSSAGK
jgi:hypothetical protein